MLLNPVTPLPAQTAQRAFLSQTRKYVTVSRYHKKTPGALRAFVEETKASSPVGQMNQLERLKTMSKVVADTGEIDLVKQYAPVDCTTNPRYCRRH